MTRRSLFKLLALAPLARVFPAAPTSGFRPAALQDAWETGLIERAWVTWPKDAKPYQSGDAAGQVLLYHPLDAYARHVEVVKRDAETK